MMHAVKESRSGMLITWCGAKADHRQAVITAARVTCDDCRAEMVAHLLRSTRPVEFEPGRTIIRGMEHRRWY